MSVLICSILLLVVAAASAPASVLSKPVAEAIEQIAKKSGRAIPSQAFGEALETAFRRYGDDALKAAGEGGQDLAAAVGKHGPEVMELAARMPKAAPALARNADELLPFVRSHGDGVLALEAKIPGATARAARVFDDASDIARLNRLPPAEAEKVIAYAGRADSPASARMLLTAVEKNGRTVLERLSPQQIRAYGLTAAMLTVASAPVVAVTRLPTDEIPKTIETFVAPVGKGMGTAFVVVALGMTARMLLSRRRRERATRRETPPIIDVTPPEDPPASIAP